MKVTEYLAFLIAAVGAGSAEEISTPFPSETPTSSVNVEPTPFPVVSADPTPFPVGAAEPTPFPVIDAEPTTFPTELPALG